MCILIKNVGEKITKEQFDNCFNKNPDGFGCVIKFKGELFCFKTLKKQEAWNYYNEIKEYDEIILHFRIGTSGNKDINNVHPFFINDYTLLFHNGVISSPKPRDNLSDTHTLCDNINKLKLTTDEIFENDGVIDNLLEHKVGGYNKFLIINGNNPTKIYGESLGHYIGTTWFSNYSYEDYKPYDYNTAYMNNWNNQYKPPVKEKFKPEYKKTTLFDNI